MIGVSLAARAAQDMHGSLAQRARIGKQVPARWMKTHFLLITSGRVLETLQA